MSTSEWSSCSWNACSTDPTYKEKLFLKKSLKENYLVTLKCVKAIYTGLVAGSVAGKYLPTQLFCSKEKICSCPTALGHLGATYLVLESGWMTDTVF